MEVSYTKDTIMLKSLVSHYLSTEDTHFRILGGFGIRFGHAPYIPCMLRR